MRPSRRALWALLRACESLIGRLGSAPCRPSRQPLRGFLRMRFFRIAIKEVPHPEEARSAVSKDAQRPCSSYFVYSFVSSQDEGKALIIWREFLILRRPRKRSSQRTHRADPANHRFLARPLSQTHRRHSWRWVCAALAILRLLAGESCDWV